MGLIDSFPNTYLPRTDSPFRIKTSGVLANENDNPIGIDLVTRSLQTIDYAHHEIHSGSHYYYSSHHDQAKNTINNHLIITPNTTKWAHMIFAYSSTGGQVNIELSEGATYSNIGAVDPVFNRDRNSLKANTTVVYENPVIASQGTVIFSQKLGVNDKKISIGGDQRGSNEIILKQNTVYLFRATELNVDATVINIEFDWYEHENKTD